MESVKWGIIGAGDVCEVKSGPPLYLAKNSEVVAVMRRNERKAEDFAKRHGISHWSNDISSILNNPDINAIYIATPPDTHAHYTFLAAKSGKHVYVEKPMARTFQETESMVRTCKEHGVKLFVAYYRRYLPNFTFVKNVIAQGLIGKVRSVEIKVHKTMQPDIVGASGDPDNWRIDPKVAGGGYFYDLASHQLDMMDYLFGPITAAGGISKNLAGKYPADDYSSGYFHFSNGVVGHGVWNFCGPPGTNEEETIIYGEKGRITFPFFGDHSVQVDNGKDIKVHHFDLPKHIQFPLIEAIINDLLGVDSCYSTGESGSRTNRVMSWITDHSEENNMI